VAAVLVDTGTTLDGKINTIDTNVDAILVDTGTTIPGTITTLQADTDDIQTRLPAALVSGRMVADVEAINDVTAAATNLENLYGSVVRDPNVASATATTIVFDDALAVGTDDLYVGMTVYIYGGTGIGQARTIVDYAGATKTAIIHPNWGITPDATSDVMILPFGSTAAATTLATGAAQAGTASTIQLVATSAFADDELNGNIISIVNGTGRGQTRAITDYDSATDTATVAPNWDTTPDATSVYEVKGGSANVFSIADQVWEEAQADHATAGTFGEIATEIASIRSDGGGGCCGGLGCLAGVSRRRRDIWRDRDGDRIHSCGHQRASDGRRTGADCGTERPGGVGNLDHGFDRGLCGGRRNHDAIGSPLHALVGVVRICDQWYNSHGEEVGRLYDGHDLHPGRRHQPDQQNEGDLMAIKNIIAKGIGFSPGSVKFIPTHGFISSAAAAGQPMKKRRLLEVWPHHRTHIR
jgi:hypothetical protein